MLQIAAWCLGEFGEQLFGTSRKYHNVLILAACSLLLRRATTAAGTFTSDQGETLVPTVDKLLDIFQSLLADPTHSRTTRGYVVNALMKLSTRTSEGGSRIRSMVGREDSVLLL